APNTEHLITLGTPYRGSRFVICEATQGDFCNGVRAAGGITDWVYSEVFQFGGTKDLAWEFSGVVYVTQTSNACIYSPLGCVTLGISRSNPYLEHVNSDLGSGDYSNYTAFVGTRRDGKTYAVPGAAIRLDGY